MRKIILLAALGVLVSATGASAQQIAGSRHDLSAGSSLRNSDTAIDGQTCVFCHTPHAGSTTIPLWNRNAPTGAGYNLYTSSTLDVASPGAAGVAAGMSGACLSCHDGSIAVDVLLNLGGAAKGATTAFVRQGTANATFADNGTGAFNIMNGGTPFLGTDLRNDHPITIIYQTARAAQTTTEFNAQSLSGTKVIVASASGALPLFGTATATATVECASCHNPHNNTNGTFLRKANTGSALCLTCHIK